jgi:hypothetical protein
MSGVVTSEILLFSFVEGREKGIMRIGTKTLSS